MQLLPDHIAMWPTPRSVADSAAGRGYTRFAAPAAARVDRRSTTSQLRPGASIGLRTVSPRGARSSSARRAMGRALRRGCGPRALRRLRAMSISRHRRTMARGLIFQRLRFEIIGELAQELHQLSSLRPFTRIPRRLAGASMRNLDLVTDHLGHVAVRVELRHALVRHDVPVM